MTADDVFKLQELGQVGICVNLSTKNVFKKLVLKLKCILPLHISQIHTLKPMLLATLS